MPTADKARTYCISLDDDPMIFRILQEITKLKTLPFVSGEKLLERAASYTPLVAFIDINLGDQESGLSVLPRLREIWPATPLIVMTSDGQANLIGQSLSLGAHDFIRKPLSPEEVRARVQARVFELGQRVEENSLVVGDLVCDRVHKTIAGPQGKRILSDGEWQLFTCLAQARGMFLSKKDLKGKVWGDIAVSDNAVDRKLTAIRQALKDVGGKVGIASKYGKGVSLCTTEQRSA